MATLEDAILLATKAHKGQVDKQGLPYILHPLRVMESVRNRLISEDWDEKWSDTEIDICMQSAVLHDVVEDTNISLSHLKEDGYDKQVISNVDLLTRQRGQSYASYIKRLRNTVYMYTTIIKIADLEDNFGIKRALVRPEHLDKDLRRLNRYILTHRFLSGKLSWDEYEQSGVV